MIFRILYFYFILVFLFTTKQCYALTISQLDFFVEQLIESSYQDRLNNQTSGTSEAGNRLSEQEAIEYIVTEARKNGVYLTANIITADNFFKLDPDFMPLIAVLRKNGFILVNDISEKEVLYTDLEGREGSLTFKNFIRDWQGAVISKPLVNIEMEVYPSFGKIDYYIVYSYHLENFKNAEPILDDILEYISVDDRDIIYIDELGLIPHPAVERMALENNISEQESFEKIKGILNMEASNISKGIAIYDTNPFYSQLYRYLAQHKIKVIIEDLNYQQWRNIVMFDELDLLQDANNEFLSGDLSKAIDFLDKYLGGFWNHNVVNRDKHFINQLTDIKKTMPKATVLVIRGIGHYGLGESLHAQGYGVKEFIIGEGCFSENFASGQYLWLLKNNGVDISYGRGRELILKNFVQDFLRVYFKDKYKNLVKATRLSRITVDNMELKDTVEFSFAIRAAILTGYISDPDKIYLFAYQWVKEKNFLKKEY
jgi:hypothetical protein